MSVKKIQEYFDLFFANGSIPQITMPTRFSKKNATLIDQIFCRNTKDSSHHISGIIVTSISDHFPCFNSVAIRKKIKVKPKYIKIKKKGYKEMEAFKDEIGSQVKKTHFENNLLSDPNINYDKLESIIINAEKKCFPIREVKFNKYRHKISPWMTNEILDELKFRDKLYVKWKKMS